MNVVRRFLRYVEIMTKITSVFPFLMCLVYLYYLGVPVNWPLTGIFFASMFLFDLTTTAINNYVDTKTNGVPLQFSRGTALALIYILFALAAGLGILLALLTDAAVLLLGGLCFLCGVFYTWGPVPISRQPLGELLSGVFYGIFLPVILLYINLPAGRLFSLAFSAQSVVLSIRLAGAVPVALLCVAPACATANIMLANNICDVERDAAVGRHTLPYYLGRRALPVFAALYAPPYLASLALVLAGFFPPLFLFSLVTAPIVFRNVRTFLGKQEKSSTFVLSVQNFILLMSGNIIFMFVCALKGS